MMRLCLKTWRIIERLSDVDRIEREIDSLLNALEAAERSAKDAEERLLKAERDLSAETELRVRAVNKALTDGERRRRAEESLRAAEHRALKAEGALEEARKILDEIEDLYPWVLPEVTSEIKDAFAKRKGRPAASPQPAPRYDEVFAEGQRWLDELAGEPLCEDRGEFCR